MDIQKKQIFEFFKKLNLGLKSKKKYIVADKFKNCDSFLIYLFEMRLIKNYKIIDTSTFQIELAYDNNGYSIIKGMRNVDRTHYRTNVKLKNMQNSYISVY
jgi:ribosomal protein S8